MGEELMTATDIPQTESVEVEVLPPEHPAAALVERAPSMVPQQIVGLPAMSEIHTMEAVARSISATEMVPKAYRNKPDAILACFLAGRELRIPPMQSLRDIDIVDGKPAPSAKLVRELIIRAGHSIRRVTDISDETRATYKYRRRDWPEGEWAEATFTIDMAVKAALCKVESGGRVTARDKNGRPMPWEHYTAAMLRHRCLTTIGREDFPDCLGTMIYTAEELGAPVDEDGRLVDSPGADARTGAHIRWDLAREAMSDATRAWLDAKFNEGNDGTAFAFLPLERQEQWADFAEGTLKAAVDAARAAMRGTTDPDQPHDFRADELGACVVCGADEDRDVHGSGSAPLDEAAETGTATETTTAAATEKVGKPAAGESKLQLSRARSIAIRCREVGIDTDDKRHALVGLVTNGRVTSSKDVHQSEMDRLMRVLSAIEKSRVSFAQSGEGEWLLWDADGQPTTVEEVTAS